jgi:hypothetical protein
LVEPGIEPVNSGSVARIRLLIEGKGKEGFCVTVWITQKVKFSSMSYYV